MKKLLLIFGILFVVFICVWIFKMKAPMTPTDPYQQGLSDEKPWWEVLEEGETPTAKEEWTLDPEIPANYIPVLNGDELYMVIDENGNISKYRKRTQQEDGSWIWEDTDPNIPENYEAVEGLENVYKVVNADGTVQYFKYTRNADDTYFFTEVDAEGKPIAKDTPIGSEIPPNYVHISGNIYAVYNEYGVLIGYKERVLDANGNYLWIDAEIPTPDDESGIDDIIDDEDVSIDDGGYKIISDNIDDGSHIVSGYTETETLNDTVKEGNEYVVYQTIVTRIYDNDGNIITSKKEGPTEVNRYPVTDFNEDLIFQD